MPKLFHVVVKAAIVSNRRVLLLARKDKSDKNFWDMPGGRIDNNESIEQALKREIKEEILNITSFKIDRVLCAYRLKKDIEDGIGLVLIFYRLEADLKTIKLSGEHSSYKWFSLEELNKLSIHTQPYIGKGYAQAAKLALLIDGKS